MSRPTSFYSSSIAPLHGNIVEVEQGLFRGSPPGLSGSGLRKVGAMQGFAVLGLVTLVSAASTAEAQQVDPPSTEVHVVKAGTAVSVPRKRPEARADAYVGPSIATLSTETS